MGGIGDFFKKAVDFVPIVGDIVEGISSAKEAKKNRRFQYEMSSTAHQREVEDLRKAGLNPILSGTGGAGASTPSGSVAQVPNYGQGISSALMGKKQRELLDAQIDQANAVTSKTQEETHGQKITNDYNEWDTARKMNTGTADYPGQKERAEIAEAIQRIEESRQRVSSARDTQQRERMLNQALKANPELATWILSAEYADRRAIDKFLEGEPTLGDLTKFLLKLSRR